MRRSCIQGLIQGFMATFTFIWNSFTEKLKIEKTGQKQARKTEIGDRKPLGCGKSIVWSAMQIVNVPDDFYVEHRARVDDIASLPSIASPKWEKKFDEARSKVKIIDARNAASMRPKVRIGSESAAKVEPASEAQPEAKHGAAASPEAQGEATPSKAQGRVTPAKSGPASLNVHGRITPSRAGPASSKAAAVLSAKEFFASKLGSASSKAAAAAAPLKTQASPLTTAAANPRVSASSTRVAAVKARASISRTRSSPSSSSDDDDENEVWADADSGISSSDSGQSASNSGHSPRQSVLNDFAQLQKAASAMDNFAS